MVRRARDAYDGDRESRPRATRPHKTSGNLLMRAAIGWILLVILMAHVGAHVSIAFGFARTRQWRRAAIALWIAPLAPVWAWRAGMRTRAYAWTGALGAYALLALITY